MSGLREAFDELVADVPVYGDLDRALLQAERERRRRHGLVAGLAAAAAVVAVIVGVVATTRDGSDSQQPIEPSTPTPTTTEKTTATSEPIPTDPSEVLAVRQVGEQRLQVGGETVPGRWGVNDSRLDVWVAMNTNDDGYESQWWGKGTTTHKMPPSMGQVLRGGVVISQDARWIVWTRPASDAYSKNPPRVMEVVDTATGRVRWSRSADADAVELGALAVTNDGVVVFAHCLEPVVDSMGWSQCDDARVDVWAPGSGVTRTVPAEVTVGHGPPGTVTALDPLVRATGAHNGLLVQSSPNAPPQYVRVGARGEVDVVAALPPGTLAVTADERFVLVAGACDAQPCRWSVMSLDTGATRSMAPPDRLAAGLFHGFLSYVVERDDLVLVRDAGDPGSPAVARCSLEQARCVLISS